MKHVLVTGADGFIGSHLVEHLIAKGYKVRALTCYNSFNYWGWLEGLSHLPNLEIISGDVRDPFLCDEITKEIEIIFHLAALIGIPYSYKAPQSYIETNVNGTLNICQAALKNKVKRVMHTSTSEVYGTALYVPIDEKHPLQPQSPYSASKIGSDSIAMSFFHSFELPLSIARPFNTFGPRQSARAVIPTMISQLASGRKKIQLGDVTTTRDFNYVLDTCRAMLAIAISDQTIGQVINIGTGVEHSILDIYHQIIKIMKIENVEIERDSIRIRPPGSEVQRLLCNNDLLKKFTGFQSEFTFGKGLEETIHWFLDPNNLKKYKNDQYHV
ncbi:MAG: SDR family NAD(P)-dependent oxidoreductase [Bacteriovoracaceae bacterium]|nr:SDR family NAD(P)-dependent oxidoreductase [Bacteriovoracaceae bacterium]